MCLGLLPRGLHLRRGLDARGASHSCGVRLPRESGVTGGPGASCWTRSAPVGGGAGSPPQLLGRWGGIGWLLVEDDRGLSASFRVLPVEPKHIRGAGGGGSLRSQPA